MSKLVKTDAHLGKTPETKFKESKSITALKFLLEKNDSIKVRANEEDTIPNLDGSVAILDDNNTERITVDIQSKTLPEDYNLNGNPYKYDCDTKVFNVVIENVTFNPVVLMLVDIKNQKVYWKHISREYANSLQLNKGQETKRITFDEEDLFDIDTFRNAMDRASCELEEIIDAGISAIITSNIKEDTSFYGEMQEEIDRINSLLDNDYIDAKNLLFPNVWKFGIAYNRYTDGSEFLGIYKINKGNNGTLIKNFDFKNDKYMMCQFKNGDSKSSIRAFLNSWLSQVMNDYFSVAPINPEYLPDIILYEIVFQFLDRLADDIEILCNKDYKAVYYKDEEEISNVKRYISGLKTFYSLIINEYSDKFPLSKALLPYYSLTSRILVFNRLLSPSKEEYELLLKSIDNPKQTSNPILLSSQDVDFDLLEKVIIELDKRKIKNVKRVWKYQKWDDYISQKKNSEKPPFMQSIAKGYIDEDLYSNLDFMFSYLEESVKYALSKIPKGNKYMINGKYLLLYDKDYPYEYKLSVNKDVTFSFKYHNDKYEERIKKIEIEKDYRLLTSGRIDKFFATKLPLYTYVKLIINEGIAKDLGFDLKYDRTMQNIYGIQPIPIIEDTL